MDWCLLIRCRSCILDWRRVLGLGRIVRGRGWGRLGKWWRRRWLCVRIRRYSAQLMLTSSNYSTYMTHNKHTNNVTNSSKNNRTKHKLIKNKPRKESTNEPVRSTESNKEWSNKARHHGRVRVKKHYITQLRWRFFKGCWSNMQKLWSFTPRLRIRNKSSWLRRSSRRC